ncbi:hypothetical protein EUGRSUZ_B02098 [Eucalyptus grandis]|uniref:Uncharacterized protein n=2 Tax=Eucalyptus grandis TaxID=71139 RepID=A0ACC3LS08_EUCGR|nr:hypothetical protein EUGRSUZ_B02098 [Eucalyptus grandis]
MKAEALGSMCWSSKSRGVLLPRKKMLTFDGGYFLRVRSMWWFRVRKNGDSTSKRVYLSVLRWMVSKSLHLDLRWMRRYACS